MPINNRVFYYRYSITGIEWEEGIGFLFFYRKQTIPDIFII